MTAKNPWGGTAANSAPSAVITAPVPPPPPRLSKAGLSPTRFAAGRTTTLSFTLSEPARVTGVITQTLSGRGVHGRCRANTKKGKRCTVVVPRLRLGFNARAGANTLRLAVSRLKPGSYRLTLSARDSSGRTSKTVTLRFKIIPAVKKKHRT